MRLDESSTERAWRITAPNHDDGKVVGALRGLFSVKEYDDLIKQEIELVEAIGIGIVLVASVTFLLLILVKIHQPVRQLGVTGSGGWLAVKSAVGQDTEFAVDLPIWMERRELRDPQ